MTDEHGARRPLAQLERDVRCRTCGRTFSGTAGETYCSDECEATVRPPRISRAETDRRAASDAAALGVFGTPDPDDLEWICTECGTTFQSRRGTPRCRPCTQRADRIGPEWKQLG